MKKLLLALAIVGAMALTSNAGYLMWLTNSAYTTGDFTYSVYGDTGSGFNYLASVNAGQANNSTITFDVGNTAAQSYYVEIWNYSNSGWDVWQRSDSVSYADLAEAGAIIFPTDMTSVDMLVPFTGASYSGVPEPTSAMMILLGLAGIALKRKRV